MSFVKRGEFVINSDTAENKANNKENVQIATLTDGTFVMVWDSKNQDINNKHTIHAQRYKNKKIDGYFHPEAQYGGSKPLLPILERIGSEFRIDSTPSTSTEHHKSPQIAALAANQFVVAWERYEEDDKSKWIYCRFFNAADDTPTAITAGPDAVGYFGNKNMLVAKAVHLESWMTLLDIIVTDPINQEIIFVWTDDEGPNVEQEDIRAMMWRHNGTNFAKRWDDVSFAAPMSAWPQGLGGSWGKAAILLNDGSILFTWDERADPAAVGPEHQYQRSFIKRYKVNNNTAGGLVGLVPWTAVPAPGLLVNSDTETHDGVVENNEVVVDRPRIFNLGMDGGNQYSAILYLHQRDRPLGPGETRRGYCDVHMTFMKVAPQPGQAGAPINVGPAKPYRIENSPITTRKGSLGFDGCVLKGNKGVIVWSSESHLDGTLMPAKNAFDGPEHDDVKLTQIHGRIFTYTLGNGDVTINSWGDVFSVSNNNGSLDSQYPEVISTEGGESFMVVWQQERTSNTQDFEIVGNQYVPPSWLIENMRPKPNAIFPEPASVVNQYHQYTMSKRALKALGEKNSSNGNTVIKKHMVGHSKPRASSGVSAAARSRGRGKSYHGRQISLGNGGILTPSAISAGTMDRLARLKARAMNDNVRK